MGNALEFEKTFLDSAAASLEQEAKELARLIDYVDFAALTKAIEMLTGSDKIITCASGTSGIAAKKFAHSLCCIERDAIFMSPAEAVHGGLGCVKKGDVLVMVSRGGKTAELLPIVSGCKKKGAKLLVVTESPESIMAKNADAVLLLNIERESDPLNVMATSSFVATIALFDAILAALITISGFSLEQFGVIHPGGAVGEMLNETKA